VRNIEGTRSETPADYQARPQEGRGVVVVTVAVAATDVLPDVRDVHDANRIARTLQGMAALPHHWLSAVEIIWSPAEDEDRMSTAELETLYPELRKIDSASIAGRVFCRSCSGPYAAELLSCPHCGDVA
jgi:uncharacterized membrane protein